MILNDGEKELGERMDKRLLETLACPVCKGSLEHHQREQELVCQRDQLAFGIVDDIPIMLASEARQLSPTKPG